MRRAVGLALFFTLAGCRSKPEDPAAQVRAAIVEVQQAAEAGDIEGILKRVAPAFRGKGGEDRAAVKQALVFRYLRGRKAHTLARVRELKVETPTRVAADVQVALAATPMDEKTDLSKIQANLIDFRLTWDKTDDGWQVSQATWDATFGE